jgi:hypothetical protein
MGVYTKLVMLMDLQLKLCHIKNLSQKYDVLTSQH